MERAPGGISAQRSLILSERANRAEYMNNYFTQNQITPLTQDEKNALIYQNVFPDRGG